MSHHDDDDDFKFPKYLMGLGLLIPIAACLISGVVSVVNPDAFICPPSADPLSCYTPVDYAVVTCGACTLPLFLIAAALLYQGKLPRSDPR